METLAQNGTLDDAQGRAALEAARRIRIGS
jgi:hypothetical protein